MSAINGDKARHNRHSKRLRVRRAAVRALKQKNAALKPKPEPPAALAAAEVAAAGKTIDA